MLFQLCENYNVIDVVKIATNVLFMFKVKALLYGISS